LLPQSIAVAERLYATFSTDTGAREDDEFFHNHNREKVFEASSVSFFCWCVKISAMISSAKKRQLLLLFAMIKTEFYLKGILILILAFLFSIEPVTAQQPSNVGTQQQTPGVYLLSISPKAGGKSYTLFHRTKVQLILNDGKEIKGKVRGVSQDAISIDYVSYPIADLHELRFSPGSVIGLIAAGAMLVGVTTVAIMATKDPLTSTDEVILWSGAGLAVAAAITLIPTSIIKKKFNIQDYDFTAVMVSGY
jgi:hypothetical protein